MKPWTTVPLFLAAAIATPAQTTNLFVTGVTSPGGGAILPGAALNPNTGQPVRHLWSADNVNGLCRIDPDLDTPGAHAINAATCIRTAVGFRLVPGPISYDLLTGNLYMVDRQGKSVGIFRFHYVQSGDSGQGLMNPTQQEVLGGVSGGNSICGLGNNVPLAAALGPDGNLYVGFQKTGNLLRILSPGAEPLPCSNIQSNIASTVDGTGDSGVAWIGHDLFGVDAVAPILVSKGDNCYTPQNGFTPCRSSNISNVFNPIGAVSDQSYPTLSGTTIYYYDHLTVTQIRNVNTSQVLTRNYGGLGFQFISAFTVDASNPASQVLYVADDPTTGATEGTGRWFQVIGAPPPPAPPGTPTAVSATAGNAQANVSWTPAQDGQPVTSFTVRNTLASNGILVPDTVVTAAPGSTIVPSAVTVAGLVNLASYQFAVSAANALGSSPFSAASNLVTPFAPPPATVPGAPAAVIASPSDSSAQVAWTPAANGGSPITSYTVTELVGGVPNGVTLGAPGNASGLNVVGLTNGTTYTFTIHATNAIGSGPESAQTNAVTPFIQPTPPDLSLGMTGTASVSFGGTANYALTISNSGNTSAPQVVVTNNLPAIGATVLSATPSQGICQLAATVLSCNLGAMAGGTTAGISLSVAMLAQGTNQASVVAEDASGNPLADATPADNSASATTTIGGTTTTTDIQVVGSAQNGGPTHGGTDVYTWQIKNGGNQVANDVVFTTALPPSLPFISVSSPQAACAGPAQGSGGTITCTAASLPVGQTIVVTVNVSVPVATTVSVNGRGTFNGTDTNQGNNTFGVTIQVK